MTMMMTTPASATDAASGSTTATAAVAAARNTTVAVAAEAVPQRARASASAILEKIMQLQGEIALINLHERTHMTADGGDVKHFEPSCPYCQAHGGNAGVSLKQPLEHQKEQGRQAKRKPACAMSPPPTPSSSSATAASVMNEMERTVEPAGRSGRVMVPRTWAGKRVKIILLG